MKENIQTLVISAFPGCGKTTFTKNGGLKILDSDSSNFSWIYNAIGNYKMRNPDFPNNYIEHINENMGYVDIIFVSSHKVVRDALRKNNIPYVLVYPANTELNKKEWIRRYKQRGDSDTFIKLLNDNWDSWIQECENETYPVKCILGSKKFKTPDYINFTVMNEIIMFRNPYHMNPKITPVIITLCGPVIYKHVFEQIQKRLVSRDVIVLTPEFYNDEDKKPDIELLRDIHRNKIMISNIIIIVDEDGKYLHSEDTMSEIEFAKNLGKTIYFNSELKIRDKIKEK